MRSIYLDYAASTPLDPRAAEAVLRALNLTGNPSSVHAQGRAVRVVVEEARERVAAMVGTPASSITFTSGATEANTLAIRGTVAAARRIHPRVIPRILCGPTEHASVMETVRLLETEGAAVVTWLPVDANGVVRTEEVGAMLADDVVLVVMQWANNVTGVLQPVDAVGRAVRAERARRPAKALPIAFLCDAAQAARTQDLRPFAVGIDLLTLSAHKLYGPKGVGAIVRRPGIVLDPVAVGGGQEDGLRAGTENVSGIAGFGAAAAAISAEKEKDAVQAAMLLRVAMEQIAAVANARFLPLVTAPTVPDILFLTGRGFDDRTVLALDAEGIAVSSGSACDAGKRHSSHVLAAMGRRENSGVRVSFGRGVAQEDIVMFVDALAGLSR